MRPGDEVPLQDPEPRSFGDIVRSIRHRFAGTVLVASARMPSRGLRAPGHVVSSLPSSALDALQLDNDGDRNQPFISERHYRVNLRRVLTGGAKLQLKVRDMPKGAG